MGKRSLKILFIDETTHLDSIHDLNTQARGGMVSSLFIVPNELRKHGHSVTVKTDIKQSGMTDAGVIWINDNSYLKENFDVAVFNRQTLDGLPELNTRHRVLWTHDLPHHGFIPHPKTIKAFSATVFMSKYAVRS